MSDLEPKLPKSGPLTWSNTKMFVVIWVSVSCAILLNLLLMAGAARLWGHSGLPLGLMILWSFPISLLAALWLTRWVRRLVRDAENG